MKTKHQLDQCMRHQATISKPYTVLEILHRAKPFLKKMRRNGHTVEDIAEIFASFEISLSPRILEAYLTSTIQQTKALKLSNTTLSDETAVQLLAKVEEQSNVRKGLTRQELVRDLLEPISMMLEARYSFEDIAQLLSQQGVRLSAGTLKTYYKQAKRQHLVETDSRVVELPVDRHQASPSASTEESTTISPTLSHPNHSQEGKGRLPESTPSNQLAREFNL